MSENSKVKVLKGLPIALCKDKDLRKAFETFIYLKYYHANGTVWKYSKRAGYLASECNVSIRTFWTRLNCLTKNKLVRKLNRTLYLSSWNHVMKVLNIKEKDFYYTKVEEYNSKRRLEYFEETKGFQEKRVEMKQTFIWKFKEHPEPRYAIVSNVGVSDPEKVIEALLNLQVLNFKVRKDCEVDNPLNLLNPDFNLNVESLAFLFDERKSKSSGTYSKQKLWAWCFIEIEKRQTKSLKRTRFCILGTVFYNRGKKQTFLQLPDNIIIL